MRQKVFRFFLNNFSIQKSGRGVEVKREVNLGRRWSVGSFNYYFRLFYMSPDLDLSTQAEQTRVDGNPGCIHEHYYPFP